MPTVEISSGIPNIVGVFSGLLDEAFLNGTVTQISTTSVTIVTASATVVLTGTGFGAVGGGFVGNLETSVATLNNGETVTWSNIGLTVQEILGAYALEENQPFQVDAVENLLFPLDWEFISNDQNDVITSKSTSSDGVKVHFTGDDHFDLKGGNDKVFTSDGKDTVFAGTGHDTIWGGKGNDRLNGENGSDLLSGDKGRDVIRGGKGNDTLEGGSGRDNLNGGGNNDVINGGADDDKLRGGTGADTFIFDTNSGFDVVYDYEIGTDMLDLTDILVDETRIVDGLGGAVLQHEGGSVTFLGLTLAQLSDEVYGVPVGGDDWIG